MEKGISNKKYYPFAILFIVILSLLCTKCKKEISHSFYIFEFDNKKCVLFTKEYLQELFGDQYVPHQSVVKAKVIAIFASSEGYKYSPSIAVTSNSFIVGTSDIVIVTPKNERYPTVDNESKILETMAISIALFCDDACKGVSITVDFERRNLRDIQTFAYSKENCIKMGSQK